MPIHHPTASLRLERVPGRLCVAIAISLLLAGVPAGPALAQAGAAAPGQTARHFDIPATRLQQALEVFQQQSGLLVDASAAPEIRTTQAVQGEFTPTQALEALLAGSGLRAVASGNGYRLMAARSGADQAAKSSPTATEGPQSLGSVYVFGKARRDLPAAYAGGQVARGGRLGMLGEGDYMATPFSISAYTEALLRERQISDLRDVVKFDPSAKNGANRTYSMGGISLRGFSAVQRFNGLKIMGGMWGGPDLQTDAYERVEILKGASAVLNGGFDGLGGAINMVPKRATDDALTRITARAESRSQLGGNLDIGRRFGAHKQFGVRVNLSDIRGEAAIRDEQRHFWMGSLALDYRGARVRASLDLITQHNGWKGFQNFYGGTLYNVASGEIPAPLDVAAGVNSKRDAPKNRKHYAQARGAIGQVEIDLGPSTLLRLGHGRLADTYNAVWHTYEPTLSDATTDTYSIGRGPSRYGYTGSNAVLSHRIEGTRIRHLLTLAYDAAIFDYAGGTGDSLYYSLPAGQVDGAPDPHFLRRTGFTSAFHGKEQSIGLGDAFGPADASWRVVTGLRRQKADIRDWNGTRLVNSVTSASVGGLVRVRKALSLYGNYAEGLEPGAMVPRDDGMGSRYDNAGQIIPAFRTRQYELGAKFDLGRVGGSLAVYQLARPSIITRRVDARTLHQSVDGEQRNRGWEMSVFGEVTPGVRLIAGLALIDPVLTRTEGGVNDGHTGPGTPRRNAALSVDWDVRALPGLSLNAGANYSSRQFVDGSNTTWIKPFATFDLGASYRLPTTRPMHLTFNVVNALGLDYWQGASSYGDPRTVKLSLSTEL